jgi:hypothetical protein
MVLHDEAKEGSFKAILCWLGCGDCVEPRQLCVYIVPLIALPIALPCLAGDHTSVGCGAADRIQSIYGSQAILTSGASQREHHLGELSSITMRVHHPQQPPRGCGSRYTTVRHRTT